MVPGLDWYYNSNTGFVVMLPKVVGEAELHSGLGWHGPFDTQADAFAYYDRNHAGNPGWKAPSTSGTDALNNAGDAAATVANNVAQAPFHGLNLETWFLRIGEVLLGIVLIGVGLAKLTGTSNAIAKLAKVAI